MIKIQQGIHIRLQIGLFAENEGEDVPVNASRSRLCPRLVRVVSVVCMGAPESVELVGCEL